MVTYFFKTKIDICQSFESHFYSFKKNYAYLHILSFVLEILAFYIVNHTLPLLKSRSSKKKITRIIQCNPFQDVRNCTYLYNPYLIGNTQDINFGSKYVEVLHGSDLQICDWHSGIKMGK